MKKNHLLIGILITIVISLFMASGLFARDGKGRGRIKEYLSAKSLFRGDIDRSNYFTFEKGKGRLDIFAGSIPEENTRGKFVDVSVQKVRIEHDGKKFSRLGDAFQFGPKGLRFKHKAQLTLPYDVPEGYPEEYINIYYFNEETGEFEVMPKINQDMENNTITAEIEHFSIYAAGTGSYFVDEGGSPNTAYFKNNNERVDTHTGTLYIDRTDVIIKGRGVDFVLKSQFSSDKYFEMTTTSPTPDPRSSSTPTPTPVKIGKGWRFKLARMTASFPYMLTPWTPPSTASYTSEEGTVYNLSNVLNYYNIHANNQVFMVDGYRVYNLSYSANYSFFDSYTSIVERVVEIPREKIVLKLGISIINVNSYYTFRYYTLNSAKAYRADGMVEEFNFSATGPGDPAWASLIRLWDRAEKNYLTFGYTGGALSSITDNLGRSLTLTSESGGTYVNLSFNSGNGVIPLVKMTLNSAGELINYVRLSAGGLTMNPGTSFTYLSPTASPRDPSLLNNISSGQINITNPSGGISEYNFSPVYRNRIYDVSKWIDFKHQGVSSSIIRENSQSLDSSSHKTTYSYHPTVYPITVNGDNNYKIIDSTEILSSTVDDNNKQTKIEYKFEYEGVGNTPPVYKGCSEMQVYTWHASAWHFDRLTKYSYQAIAPEYWESNQEIHYPGYESYLVYNILPNPKYTLSYEYDLLGQITKATDAMGGRIYYDYVYNSATYPMAPGFPAPSSTPSPTAIINPTPVNSVMYSDTYRFIGLPYRTVKDQDASTKQIDYFLYDNKCNLTSIINATSNSDPVNWPKTTLGYDSTTNNLTSIMDSYGKVLNLEYGIGAQSGYIIKDSRQISFSYETRWDEGNYLFSEFAYDDLGRMTKKRSYISTDAAGVNPITEYISDYTKYTYDALNRVTRVQTSPDDTNWTQRKEYIYNDDANTLTILDGINNKTVKTYDGLDRLVNEKSYKPAVSPFTGTYTQLLEKDYTYHKVFTDLVESVKVHEDPQDPSDCHLTETTYDPYGRVLETIVNGLLTSEILYTDESNTVTQKNYRDGTYFTQKRTQKNWNNQIVSTEEWNAVSPTGAADIVTSYDYDKAGNLVKMTNPEQEEFIYDYNVLGQLTTTTYVDGTSESKTYDLNGNVSFFTDRKGQTTNYDYDSLNRLRTTTTIDSILKTDYTQFGGVKEVTGLDGAGTVQDYNYTYLYNGLGQLTNLIQKIGTSTDYQQYENVPTYDLAGNVDLLFIYTGTDPVLVKTLDYDPVVADTRPSQESRVMELTDIGDLSSIAQIHSKYWGGIEEIEYGNDLFGTTYGYDELLRPTDIITNGGRMDLSYEYDYQGNVLSWTGSSVEHRSFTYDGMDRLETESKNGETTGYDYDFIGNRTVLDNPGTTPDVNYEYTDTDNTMWLISDGTWTYSYDANGNMIGKTKTGETWEYVFDASNRMTGIKKNGLLLQENVYDANGLRIKKIDHVAGTTTLYVYNGQSILFEETFDTTDVHSSSIGSSRELNVELNGMNVAKYVGTPNGSDWDYALQYHLLDHLGSRQMTLDSDGNVIMGENVLADGTVVVADGNQEYATFGEQTGGLASEASFTNKKLDANLGLYYFNARWYDPSLGRFTSLDPIKDGTNWYVYCENNPLKCIDPSGTEVIIIITNEMASPDGGQIRPYPGPEGNAVNVATYNMYVTDTVTGDSNTYQITKDALYNGAEYQMEPSSDSQYYGLIVDRSNEGYGDALNIANKDSSGNYALGSFQQSDGGGPNDRYVQVHVGSKYMNTKLGREKYASSSGCYTLNGPDGGDAGRNRFIGDLRQRQAILKKLKKSTEILIYFMKQLKTAPSSKKKEKK
ncbi:MAG: RHS repeat-associated core domain-containing protein [Spirochaetales bacterium]|nr:RHS repeat-associated core domain-containing protein [Spirochaetales bacterium]